jgi:hypothetical protein
VVDRIDTWRNGSTALWLGPEGVAVEGANRSRGDRPWVPHPLSRRERAALAPAKPTAPPQAQPEPEMKPDPEAETRASQPD